MMLWYMHFYFGNEKVSKKFDFVAGWVIQVLP